MTLWFFLACAASSRAPLPVDTAPAPASILLQGGRVVGQGLVDVWMRDGRILEVGEGLAAEGAEVIDVSGRFLVPAFIDSHVHLAYLPEGGAMADGGVAGAVDLAAPIEFLAIDHAPLEVRAAGPMITASGGYPTRSWGSDGYGLECTSAAEAVAAVDRLHNAGASVVKLPITADPQLDDGAISVATARAHALGMRVASHALSDDEASRAAAAGVDALAHTPTSELSSDTLASWSGRAVISTLGAFGGRATTLANLAALRDAGATVLYGTDFGNSRFAGIDPDEILLLQSAGLSGAEILAAGTSAPAAFWGFEDLGVIAVGRAASLLVLPADPLVTPESLTVPEQVWIAGERRR
ncbi:amidohydrolase [Deltaproteobacteria bacterium]|nr:amidohydrolase [Deltaproteobacteria bacterium]